MGLIAVDVTLNWIYKKYDLKIVFHEGADLTADEAINLLISKDIKKTEIVACVPPEQLLDNKLTCKVQKRILSLKYDDFIKDLNNTESIERAGQAINFVEKYDPDKS